MKYRMKQLRKSELHLEEKNKIIECGKYIEHIESLMRFYKREQILILISEDSRKKPEKTIRTICKFIGVSPDKTEIKKEINKGEHLLKISNDTEKKLYNLYKPYNERLFKFLGYRIPEWEDH